MPDAPAAEATATAPRPGWLAALEARAAGLGLTLSRPSVRDRALTLFVQGGAAPELGVEVLPRAPGERYYLETPRHGLRHHGRAAPAPAQRAALARLAEAIAAVEAGWPEVLSLAGAAGAAGDAAVPFTVERAHGGDQAFTELLVRITARCNQRCPFCSAPPPHPDADAARLGAFLDLELPRHARATVTLTGGEPTLWPGLPALVAALGRRPDVGETRVQTNAVALADPRRAAEYAPRPGLVFFVSFHAARADPYDRCTGTEGQFDRAVAGIRNLLAAGHPLTLNVVASAANVDHLAEWPDGVAALFGDAGRPRLHFSVTMCPEHRPGASGALVPYATLAPRLLEAARRARALGLPHDPLLASSHAAIPACLLPAGERRRGATADGRAVLPELAVREVGRLEDGRPWVKGPGCGACAASPACLGVPRPYALRFGLAELSPLDAAGEPTA